MTSQNGFDRTLSDWLAAENAPDVPDWVYEACIRRSANDRPVQADGGRADTLASAPRHPARAASSGPGCALGTVALAPAVLVVALVIVALATAVLLVGAVATVARPPVHVRSVPRCRLDCRPRHRPARDTDRAAGRPSLAHQRHQSGCLRPGNRPVRSLRKPPLSGLAGRVGHAPARRHGPDRRRRRR